MWRVFLFMLGAALFFGGFSLTKSRVVEIIPAAAQISQIILPEPKPNNEKIITLILTGDIMLNRRVELAMKSRNDYRFPFLKIVDELKKADVLFGNLEGPISDKGQKVGSIYSFRADPRVIEGLTFAGFDVLSLANNHTFDYGKVALEDTFLRLDEAKIDYAGAGLNEEKTYGPRIKEVDGTKIGFLAYTNSGSPNWVAAKKSSGLAFADWNNLEKIKQAIRKAKSQTDVLIVSLHAGEEYIQEPNQFQVKFSKTAIDAGADLVVGHHPHIVQPNEKYGEGYIFYSLGNFVFDQSFSEETMQGQIVKVLIENKKIKDVIPIKIKINEFFQPEIKDKI